MDEDRRNLLGRQEILRAMVKALERPDELLRVCAGVAGDIDEARRAVGEAFGVSEHGAWAILDLQVRRFTPQSLAQIRGELRDVDARLAR